MCFVSVVSVCFSSASCSCSSHALIILRAAICVFYLERRAVLEQRARHAWGLVFGHLRFFMLLFLFILFTFFCFWGAGFAIRRCFVVSSWEWREREEERENARVWGGVDRQRGRA